MSQVCHEWGHEEAFHRFLPRSECQASLSNDAQASEPGYSGHHHFEQRQSERQQVAAAAAAIVSESG